MPQFALVAENAFLVQLCAGETFGVATAEAAAAGVPTAGFASCGVLESTDDNNSDLAGWPPSPLALAQAAERLLLSKVCAVR